MLELTARIIFFLCLLAFVFPLLHVKKPEEYFGMFDFILQVFMGHVAIGLYFLVDFGFADFKTPPFLMTVGLFLIGNAFLSKQVFIKSMKAVG